MCVDITVVPLLSGEIHAQTGYIQNAPNQVRLVGREVNQILVDSYGIEIYGSVIVVNEQFLMNNAELVRKLIEACIKGWEYSVANTPEAIQILIRSYPLLDQNFVKSSTIDTLELLKSPDVEKYGLGYQSMTRWRNLQQMLFEQGILKEKINLEHLFTNNFLHQK